MVVYLPVRVMAFFLWLEILSSFFLTSASARQADSFHVIQDVDLSNCGNLFLNFGGQPKEKESMHTTHEN